MKKKIAAALMATLGAASAFAQTTAQTTAAAAAPALGGSVKYLAAALAVSVAAVAGGIAVAKIGSAAMGAMAEKPELSGKALPYVGLAEGICLWGFLVALLILLL
jgi:V/A-type H+-transporting ATPase subunit K